MDSITVDDCFTKFADEWVCLEVLAEEPGRVVEGNVVAHDRQKEKVLASEQEFRRKRPDATTYVFFAGPIFEPRDDVVVVL